MSPWPVCTGPCDALDDGPPTSPVKSRLCTAVPLTSPIELVTESGPGDGARSGRSGLQPGNDVGYQVTKRLQVRLGVWVSKPHGLDLGQPGHSLRQSSLFSRSVFRPSRTGDDGSPQANASPISLRTQSSGSRSWLGSSASRPR